MKEQSAPLPHTIEWVLLRWDIRTGYYYVGPFENVDAAVAWADAKLLDLEWHTHFVDPTLSLPIRAPGRCRRCEPRLPAWLGDAAEPAESWTENQGPDGAFYVLMATAEPPYWSGRSRTISMPIPGGLTTRSGIGAATGSPRPAMRSPPTPPAGRSRGSTNLGARPCCAIGLTPTCGRSRTETTTRTTRGEHTPSDRCGPGSTQAQREHMR
jgi:hypothetical protein